MARIGTEYIRVEMVLHSLAKDGEATDGIPAALKRKPDE